MARASSTRRWMARFNGRAPYVGIVSLPKNLFLRPIGQRHPDLAFFQPFRQPGQSRARRMAFETATIASSWPMTR